MRTIKVGMREFRAGLAEYLASTTPVAITRHGQTVGYFIPTRGQEEADLSALKKAGETLDKLLVAQSVDLETVAAEFKKARKRVITSKAALTVQSVSDARHRTLRVGDALAEIGQSAGLTDEDCAVFEHVRDTTPAEPIGFPWLSPEDQP